MTIPQKILILTPIVIVGFVALGVKIVNKTGIPASNVATSTVQMGQSTSTQTSQIQTTTSEQAQLNCSTVLSIDESNKQIALSDKIALHATSSSQEINGRSDGGGGQISYYDNGETPVIEQRFYGESSRSYMRFYYSHGKLFALTKLNLFYKVPLYVENSAKVVHTEEQDYYFDENSNVCRWFVNDKEQTVDATVIQAVSGYVKGVITK